MDPGKLDSTSFHHSLVVMTQHQNQTPNDEKENKNEPLPSSSTSAFARSKRNSPTNQLSDTENDSDEPGTELPKRIKTSQAIFGAKAVNRAESSPFAAGNSTATSSQPTTTIQLPVLRIQPSLGGGKELRFPITPRATLLELKDFILFSLNIPHFHQVLTFKSAADDSRINLTSFPETVLLSEIPGLIDEVTGYAAPVALSFKMSSGMDLTPYGTHDFRDSENEDFSTSGFDFDSAVGGPGNEFAASLASLIPLPPGTPANSRVLIRAVSKASATNSNLPTLWEVYLPDSNIKMLVSAVINIQKRGSDSETPNPSSSENESFESSSSNAPPAVTAPLVPKIVITPPKEEEEQEEEQTKQEEKAVTDQMDSLKLASPACSEPKPFCSHCKIRCRPALRFVCKCGLTFCQTHRYPDKHACTFDHRAAGLASIQANNPRVVKDKVENI